MKLATLTMMAAAAVLTGCDSSSLLSVDPLVSEQNAVFDPGLLGTWTGVGHDDSAVCIIRRGGDSGYKIAYVNDGSAKEFDAMLFRAGETQVLDLSASANDDFVIAPHMAVRIWLEGAQLRWAYLDSEWLRAEATQRLSNRPAGKKILLTAPTAAVEAFLMNYAGDDKATGEIAAFTRLQ